MAFLVQMRSVVSSAYWVCGSELLTLSINISPDTSQRKLISAACIGDLILLGTTKKNMYIAVVHGNHKQDQ